MTDETLLGLALQAMTDDDAIAVLQDAAFELTPEQNRRLSDRVLEHFSWWEINTGPRVNAFAIAAVLLFESWPTSWPLAERCKLDLLHPNGRCSCWGEGTCFWCRIPCRHGGPQVEYCAECDDEATEAMLAQEPMRTWLDDLLPSQRHGDAGDEKR